MDFELVLEKVVLSTWVLTRKTSRHVFVFSYYSQHDVFSLISPTRGESGGIYTM